MTLRVLVVTCVVGGLGAGCGVFGSKDARCDLRPGDAQCTDIRDFNGPSLLTFQGVCETLRAAKGSGSYTEGAICDSANSVGGCQSTTIDGTKQTNWYYSGTAAEAQAECASGQTFVSPAP